MPTPSIQTLRNDAQQVLNLDSISAVRSVVAATLANANAGTPLNPNLTTQQLWNQFYQIVTQPKSDIESIIANQLMKFVFAPPAPGGAGANHEVIYNNNGVLAGDTKFLWDDGLNKLDIDGSATISGDLTVRTTGLTVNSSGVGVGTSSQSSFLGNSPKKLVIGDGTQTPALTLYGGTANVSGIYYAKGTVGNEAYRGFIEYNHAVDALTVGISGSTAMTLNATGLGVGIGPTQRLHIRLDQNAYTYARVENQNASSGAFAGLMLAASGDTWGIANGSTAANSNSLAFYNDAGGTNSVKMLISPTGNVGIGVTPSATNSTYYQALEIGRVGQGLTGAKNALTASPNSWLSNNSYASYSGALGVIWNYAVSQPAAQYRLLDASHQWFNAPSGTAGASAAVTSGQLYTVSVLGSSTLAQWQAFFSALAVLPTVGQVVTATATGSIVGGGTVTQNITFTQAMTLDASGNLLVGKTAIGTTVGIEARPDGYLIATRSASTDGAAFTNAVYSTGASAYRFYVGLGGTVFATNTTISAISDARFKENVQDIDVGLGAILALKPRKFDWKAGKGKDIKGDRGFIAQEFEQVFPQLVDEWADPAPEGEAPYKSVRQDLIPVLVKAIQELAAEVNALKNA